MWRNPVKVQQIAQQNTQEITQEMRLILRLRSNFTFSNINPDVTLIDIECEDQGKFTKNFQVIVRWQPEPRSDEQPNSYADIISEYGVPIAILLWLFC